MSAPVTILSGALGAGKTTTLNHVLTADHGSEVAVLVNDVGEVNVDSEVIERRVGGEHDVVELSNGCICCGIAGEFEQAVTDLALEETFEYLLVEPSGISEPKPVARQFVRGPAAGFYQLASVTTVVNARQFYDAFGAGEAARRGEDGDRPLSDLIVDGVEFCDRVVINKTDLVTEAELDSVVGTVRTLRPTVDIVRTEFGAIDPDSVFDRAMFDAEAVDAAASWKRALRQYDADDGDDSANAADSDADYAGAHDDHTGAHDEYDEHDGTHDYHAEAHDHSHPPEVYGIDSFVYERTRPLDPGKLLGVLRDLPDGVVRAKGWLHVAGRPDHALRFSLSGGEASVGIAGRWVASLDGETRKRHRESRESAWDDRWGDRRTKVVFIGRDVDEGALCDRLDACLTAAGEAGDPHAVPAENPFPGETETELRL